jgi:hypothetical protein
MAALAGANTTTLTETIPTEKIAGLVIPAANLIRVYEAITWQCPGTGAKLVWPQIVAAAVTGTQTEADEFTATNLEAQAEEVSPAMVGKRSFHSDQVDLEGSILTMQARVDAMADEVLNRVDKDVLGLFGGADNVSDNTGDNLDLDLFDAALAAFHAQKPTFPRIAFVGSTNQIRDLRKAIRQSAGGGMVMNAGSSVFNGLPVMGYCGEWQGVEIYQGNTTQADASNDAGGFVSCPPLGTAGPTGILPGSGLGLGVWRGLSVGAERIEARVGTDIVVSTYYGAGITAQNNVRGFISLKAAA